jgi:hypothetical protein
MPWKLRPLTLALALGWSAPLAGQVPDWVNQVLAAANLPVSAAAARSEGASDQEIRQVLDVMMKENIPAHEAGQVIEQERAARREYGPVDNFGAFVQSRLEAGLRGRQLAAAIREEHARHGKGKAAGQGKDKARGPERGKNEQRDQGPAKNRPGQPGDTAHGRKSEPPARPPEARPARPDAGAKPSGKPAHPNR